MKKVVESCSSFAEELSYIVNKTSDQKTKKEKGQFFTSSDVAKSMAEMVVFNKKHIKILDAGSGIGILIAAIVDRVIEENIDVHLTIDAYENDAFIIPFLTQTFEYCAERLAVCGKKFTFSIIEDDFIISNHFLFDENVSCEKYDLMISNPPYFKVNQKHPYSCILKKYLFGQPNVYFMFVIVGIKLLKKKGQLVFISPRSYCSGKYFETFREFFIDEVKPFHYHLFDSRNNVFSGEQVQQEVLITSAFKQKKKFKYIKISKSEKDQKTDKTYITVLFNEVIGNKGKHYCISLPTTTEEYNILKNCNSWKNRLSDYGMKISTGPVVKFRNKDYITKYDPLLTYPLIHTTHIKNGNIEFPSRNNELGIYKSSSKQNLIFERNNFVLVKRISSKEQSKRLDCAAFIEKKYSFEKISIEDHVNYIYNENGLMSDEETIGLASFLNSRLIDIMIRTTNGNTQINAFDIQNMPLPSHSFIVELGKKIIEGELVGLDIEKYLFSKLYIQGGNENVFAI